jgi:large subunit ribosomal protein L25
MADTSLTADPRTPVGSRPTRRLRTDGRIPAVVYGDGVGPLPVSVEGRLLRQALSTAAGLNAVLSVRVGDKEYTTMAREIQRHPVRGTVTHVDFQVVDPDRPVSADVTVMLTGDPLELHHQDGVLEQQLFSISVRAKPSEIPQHFEVDVSDLVVGTAVRISDLTIPAGVEVDLDPDTVIAAGQPPRVVRAEGEEGVAAEGEEGVAAPEAGAAGSAEGTTSEES